MSEGPGGFLCLTYSGRLMMSVGMGRSLVGTASWDLTVYSSGTGGAFVADRLRFHRMSGWQFGPEFLVIAAAAEIGCC